MAVFLSGLGAFGGCSSGDDNAKLDPEDLALRLAEAICTGAEHCCNGADVEFDRSACVDGLVAGSRATAPVAAAVRYDAAAAAKCVVAVQARYSACGSGWEISECDPVLLGTVPEGSACTSDFECEAPSGDSGRCSGPKAEVPNTCFVWESPKRGLEGDDCLNSCEGSFGEFCYVDSRGAGNGCYRGDALYCDSPTGDVDQGGKCRRLLENGETCRYNAACLSTNCSQDGTCEPTRKDGAACDEDYVCESDFCRRPEDGSERICHQPGWIPSAESCGSLPEGSVWRVIRLGGLE